jgi:hypothetical protein
LVASTTKVLSKTPIHDERAPKTTVPTIFRQQASKTIEWQGMVKLHNNYLMTYLDANVNNRNVFVNHDGFLIFDFMRRQPIIFLCVQKMRNRFAFQSGRSICTSNLRTVRNNYSVLLTSVSIKNKKP